MLNKQLKRKRRHKRVRVKVRGTAQTPRLCVFRSSRHIYAQIIDDEKGKTLANANDREIKAQKQTKTVLASEVGRLIAEKAKAKKIEQVVFDRAGYQYHGRVKAIAEAARKVGLKF